MMIASCVGTTTFVLTNEAKEQIERAVVEVNDKKVELFQIEPGGRAEGMLGIGGDDEYHVTIRFQSGKVLDRRLGYVTSGAAIRDELSVSETDIVL